MGIIQTYLVSLSKMQKSISHLIWGFIHLWLPHAGIKLVRLPPNRLLVYNEHLTDWLAMPGNLPGAAEGAVGQLPGGIYPSVDSGHQVRLVRGEIKDCWDFFKDVKLSVPLLTAEAGSLINHTVSN